MQLPHSASTSWWWQASLLPNASHVEIRLQRAVLVGSGAGLACAHVAGDLAALSLCLGTPLIFLAQTGVKWTSNHGTWTR